MGMLAKRRERRIAERAEAERIAADAERIAAEAAQQAARKRYARFLWLCENWRDAYDETKHDTPIRCRKGEEVIGMYDGAQVGLVESVPRRVTVGRSAGTSFRVAKGVTLRTGGSKGRVVHLPDELKVLDLHGAVVVTNKRVVYVGGATTREFRLDKLIAIRDSDYDGQPVVMLPVENRQRTSGILAGGSARFEWLLMMVQVAAAVADETVNELSADIRTEATEECGDFESFYAEEHAAWGDDDA